MGKAYITIPAAERIVEIEKGLKKEMVESQLADMYPGYPDGYLFVDTSAEDGRRIAAWKVDGDVEFEALHRDFGALVGPYASAVRATYREELLFR